jgi:hypothetical protein
MGNNVDHPKVVNLRESEVIRPIEDWLTTAFGPARIIRSAGRPIRRSTIALSAHSTGEPSSHNNATTGPTAGSPTATSASPADLLFFGLESANRSISF